MMLFPAYEKSHGVEGTGIAEICFSENADAAPTSRRKRSRFPAIISQLRRHDHISSNEQRPAPRPGLPGIDRPDLLAMSGGLKNC